MRRHLFAISALSISILMPPLTFAQMDDAVAYARSGKHNIELSVGLLSKFRSTSSVAIGGVIAENKSSGLMGSFGYAYWIEENIAATVSGSAISADANVSTNGAATVSDAATVTPILFGVKYQPFSFTTNEKLRPFISVAIGPYIGAVSSARTNLPLTLESYTETAIGARVGLGLDFAVVRWLQLGVGAGYHLMDDFEKRVGSRKNYSGPEFGVSLGVLL